MGKNRSESLPLDEILPILEVKAFIQRLPELNIPLAEGLELFSEFLFSLQTFWRSAEDNPVRLRTPNNPQIVVTGYSTEQGFPESSTTPDRPGQFLISPDLLDGFEDLLAFVNSIVLGMKRYTTDLKSFSGFLQKISSLWMTNEQFVAIRKSMEDELLSKAAKLKTAENSYARLAALHRLTSRRKSSKSRHK